MIILDIKEISLTITVMSTQVGIRTSVPLANVYRYINLSSLGSDLRFFCELQLSVLCESVPTADTCGIRLHYTLIKSIIGRKSNKQIRNVRQCISTHSNKLNVTRQAHLSKFCPLANPHLMHHDSRWPPHRRVVNLRPMTTDLYKPG